MLYTVTPYTISRLYVVDIGIVVAQVARKTRLVALVRDRTRWFSLRPLFEGCRTSNDHLLRCTSFEHLPEKHVSEALVEEAVDDKVDGRV